MELPKERIALILTLNKVLQKKKTRKEHYLIKQAELVEICRKCSGSSKGAWYCEDCTTGRKLQNLDAEYADVNNWWNKRFAQYG